MLTAPLFQNIARVEFAIICYHQHAFRNWAIDTTITICLPPRIESSFVSFLVTTRRTSAIHLNPSDLFRERRRPPLYLLPVFPHEHRDYQRHRYRHHERRCPPRHPSTSNNPLAASPRVVYVVVAERNAEMGSVIPLNLFGVAYYNDQETTGLHRVCLFRSVSAVPVCVLWGVGVV